LAPAGLADAVRRAHAGEALFPTELLVRLLRGPAPPPQGRQPEAGGMLGPREREVLEVLAAGASTQEAADGLGISPHTVRAHVKHAMAKLGARSRLEAVTLALSAGLIRPAG
jgi:two-component system nitrate/nitrite response regulator NarL